MSEQSTTEAVRRFRPAPRLDERLFDDRARNLPAEIKAAMKRPRPKRRKAK